MKRPVKVILGVVVVLLLIQVVRPSHENPPVTGDLQAPADVKAVLKRSCYDCHSNETVWPWYSNVAPVSWLVARDVSEGREHLNFSEFASYEPGRAKHKLEEIEQEVAGDEMPMAIYLPMHPEAKLSEADKKLIVDWAKLR